MANTILVKRSAVSGKVPLTGDLSLGEIAINTFDGKMYIKKDNGTASIVEIGSGGGGGATVTVSETAPASPTSNQIWWKSDIGVPYIYYNDGNTSQWVQFGIGATGPAGEAGPAGPNSVSTSTTSTITGIIKGASGALAAAVAGTDYLAPSGALGTPSSGTLTNCSGLPLTTGVTGTLPIANGGTGATTAANALTSLGAYPSTNPSGYTSNTGTVTSVSGTGTVNGITLTGTVTSSGSLTLGGTLSGVSLTTQVTGTLPIANGGTGKTSAPAANAELTGFTSTATAGGTTTLTNTSSYYQVFTGTANQTVVLPSTATLAAGWSFHIVNNSTGTLTLQTSTAVTLLTVPPGVTVMPTALNTTGNTATDWETGYTDFSTITGTGSAVLATSPTLVTPVLGTPASGTLSNCTVDGVNPVGFRNVPRSGTAKNTSYTLVVGDVGEFIELTTGGSVTVPNNVFATGDVVSIFNNTSAGITLTMSITTAYIGGTDTDRATITLATRGVATILFISGTVCVVNGNVT